MKTLFKASTLATLSALSLSAYAVTIPASDKPGAQLVPISKPTITQLPHIGPKISDATTQTKQASQPSKQAPRFLVKKFDIFSSFFPFLLIIESLIFC